MNRNLLKQIWNERRSNAFLWMELFVVFVILWYIVDVVYVTGVVFKRIGCCKSMLRLILLLVYV